jgi:hypothetical protein
MPVSLQKAVGSLEGRVHGIEGQLKEVKEAIGGLDAKLDEVIVQIAVARARSEKKRKQHGRTMAIVSGVGTALAAFFIKWKGGA